MPAEFAGLLAAVTALVYSYASGSGDGVSPSLFAVIAAGLVVSILGLVASAVALATGRFAPVAQALGIGCAVMLATAAAGAASGV